MADESDTEEILEFLRAEQEAFYKGDWDAFVDHWHHGPETRRILSGPMVGTRIHRGWDELRPGFEVGFRDYPQDFKSRDIIRNENVQVQVAGDMAWVSYDQVAAGHHPGMNIPRYAHGVKILQRFGGVWKITGLFEVAPNLGREDVPCIELGPEGQVLYVNALADQRIQDHPGLIISGNRLRARQRRFGPELANAIEDRRTDLSTNLPPGFLNPETTVVHLGESDAGHPIFCWVAAEQERIIVTFDDAVLLQRKLKTAAEAFSLSPAQLALTHHLAAGLELGDAARELGVSVNTVRTQVKRIFDKTGAHSRAALITLLLSIQGP